MEESYKIGKGKYQSLHDYLSSTHDVYIGNDGDLENIIRRAGRAGTVDENIGVYSSRMQYNEREKAFHDQWQKENEPLGWINSGSGILPDLFIESGDPLAPVSRQNRIIEINSRDRKIVATVIQWLGSNCGMSFLGESLARFGYKIVKK